MQHRIRFGAPEPGVKNVEVLWELLAILLALVVQAIAVNFALAPDAHLPQLAAVSTEQRRCNDSELKNVLARLFSPDVPTRSFRRVVEFWLGRGLPYEYSRTYDLREMNNWIMTSDGLMPPSELTPVTA